MLGAWETDDPEVRARLQAELRVAVERMLESVGLTPAPGTSLVMTTMALLDADARVKVNIDATCVVRRDVLAGEANG